MRVCRARYGQEARCNFRARIRSSHRGIYTRPSAELLWCVYKNIESDA